MAIQIVTANRLRDGAVVYLGPDRKWVDGLDQGRRLTSKADIEAALRDAAADVAAMRVVNPYPIEVVETATGVKPLRMREIIRAAGPTVRMDLGKQAELPR